MTDIANASMRELNLPALLVIMDGFGITDAGDGNAIGLASTPVLDALMADCPHVQLAASGLDVGLPAGQMGNSEVGHLNIGAGRVVAQELTRIDTACENGELAQNEVLRSAFASASLPGKALHLMGLLSDGGVHSHNTHLYAIIEAAAISGVREIYIHAFMDGRDVSPTSGAGFLDELQSKIDGIVAKFADKAEDGEGDGASIAPSIEIATVSGRYYAMDRDNRWDRVARAYNNMVAPVPDAVINNKSAADVVRESYDGGITDEFIEPLPLYERGVHDGDSVVFFNFRPDRARELTYAFTDSAFDKFKRSSAPLVNYVCLTEYDAELDVPVAFPKTFPQNVLADVLADAGLKQYHIAETEKYAHVTFFLNGGIEAEKSGEIRKLISSPKVATYDLQPEMSAPLVADTLSTAISADEADVYIVNFANCDMVGHTGVIPAAEAAVEAVDKALGKVLTALKEKGGIALITADHGNADQMLTDDGSPMTAHTTAPVPLILADFGSRGWRLAGSEKECSCDMQHPLTSPTILPAGKLADIAPTLLEAIGLQVPAEMTGTCLLVK